MGSFKLTTWCHWIQTWKEMLIVTFWTCCEASSNIPVPLTAVLKLYLQTYLVFLHQIRLKLFAKCVPHISTCINYTLLFCSCHWLNLEKPDTLLLSTEMLISFSRPNFLKIFLVFIWIYSALYSVSCINYLWTSVSLFLPPRF